MKGLKRFVTGAAGIAMLSMGAACATTDETANTVEATAATTVSTADAPVIVETINGDRPAMWRLADADTNIYLLGTFHLLPPGTEWTSAAVDSALADTGVTYFEADTTSPQAQQQVQQAVQQYGLNPPGTTLSSILGEERSAKFTEVAGRFGIPMAQLEPLKPWLASLTVTIVAYQQAGFDPNSGVETVLTGIVTEQNDEVRYLESAVDQIKALATLDEALDFAAFDDGLDQVANLEEEIGKLLAAWRSGNVVDMEALLVGSIRDASEAAYEALLVNRNANWVEQIDDLMEGEGDYFIAVGAGHLVGEQSVVDMLRKKGYTVTRVQ